MTNKKQKSESIRMLAHDLNNMLSPILGYTELALEEIDPDSQAAKNLNQVFEVVKRAKVLVEEILILSRKIEKP
jgi:signal transduction histidine kinase